MDSMDNLTKDQLEDLQMKKENEYRLAMDSLATVEIQDTELAHKIAEIQLERKNLAIALIQGKHNLRRIASELRCAKTMLFRRIGGM